MAPELDLSSELQQLEVEGRLTPETVIDAARDPASRLHSMFEWDDTAAAHQYRLDQARAIIRSVRVEVRVDRRRIQTVAYVRDPEASARQPGYVRLTKITEVDRARDVMLNELARVSGVLERARGVANVLGLSDELTALVSEATKLAERAREAA